MGKLARRKKTVVVDGASFLISPLTFDQIEQYTQRATEFHEKHKNGNNGDAASEVARFSPEDQRELRDNTFFVICAGMNNADETLGLQSSDLSADMDDITAAWLFGEIMEFTGIHVPKLEEIKRQIKTAGELAASS